MRSMRPPEAVRHRDPQSEGTPVNAAPGRSQASSRCSTQHRGAPAGRLVLAVSAVLVLAGLAGCGEKPQAIGDAGNKDEPAFKGSGTPYVAAGWQPGDKASWEQHLRSRMQLGQNDYSRAN